MLPLVVLDHVLALVEADPKLDLEEVDPALALVEAEPVAALVEVDPVAALVEVDPVAALREVDPVAVLVEVDPVAALCSARLGQAASFPAVTVQGSFSWSALVVPLSLCSLLSPHNPSATMPARPPSCFSTANKGEG